MWDPVSWALSFGASQVAKKFIGFVFRQDPAMSAVRDAARKWADGLAPEFPVNANETLTSFFGWQTDSEETECRERLTREMHADELPSEATWMAALVEQWLDSKSSLGEHANTFFAADFTAIDPHLRALAKSLYRATMSDAKKFRPEVMSILKEIRGLVSTMTDIARERDEESQRQTPPDEDSALRLDSAHWRLQQSLVKGCKGDFTVTTDPFINGSMHDVFLSGREPSPNPLGIVAIKTNVIDFHFVDAQLPLAWERREILRTAWNLRRDRQSHHHSTLLVVAPESWLAIHGATIEGDLQLALPKRPKGRNRVRFLERERIATLTPDEAARLVR